MQPTAARSPSLNFFNLATDSDNAADDFMTRNARVSGRAAPLVARSVNVRVTNAAEQDVDLHVVRQNIAPSE